MTLLIAVFAAVITTIIWYTNDRRSQLKLGTLALMYWGASLMWMVDAVVEYIETTFEHQYLLKNKKGGDCQPVWWMCPKGNFEEDPHAKVPKYIHFPEEHLMLLKEAK